MKQIIEVSHLKYKYPQSHVNSLNDVSFNVHEGEWLSIIGHNGSGKSTLVSALDGLIKADAGSIVVNGIELSEKTVWQVRQQIGLVFQNPDDQFVGTTVEDDIAFGLQNRQVPTAKMRQIVDDVLATVDMTDFKHHQPDKLSGGQKQRVALAGIIALNPPIIILDEATNMLDPLGLQQILDVIQSLKAKYHLTVVSITHDVTELKYADRILVVNDGRVVAENTPPEIFAQPERLLSMGLAVPLAEQIKLALSKQGIQVPSGYTNEEELVKWISQFPSIK